MKKYLLFLLMFVLSGCASSSVVVGNVRTPLSPSQVKIYLHPPKKYEEVALLESSSKGALAIGAQAKTNIVIDRLKEEAAKLGANGVLLGETGEQYAGSANNASGTATKAGDYTYARANGISNSIFHKTGKGVAIFVTEE